MKNFLHNSLRALFLSLAVLLAMPVFAEEVRIDGINYKINAETKEATVINGHYSGEVIIPESVEHEGTTYSVTSIGNEAFYLCSRLTSVTIGNSVTSIGDYAFYWCDGLTSVTIGNSVTSIGDYAFDRCDGLEKIELNCKNISNWFSSFESIKEIIIGNSVESIGERAFYDCDGLTSVTIGNSVTSIGRYAFRECSGLQNVYCYAENVPSTSSNAFYSSNYKNATLHVPAASIESYKATSPWRSFGKIVALTEEETGIDEVKSENANVKTAVYDLSGRRVQKAQKGIFIQNGKLMVK